MSVTTMHSCTDGISVRADHLPDCAHRVCKRSVSEKIYSHSALKPISMIPTSGAGTIGHGRARAPPLSEMAGHGRAQPFKNQLMTFLQCHDDLVVIMSIWYTDLKIYSYLNFSHIWLEMPIQAPKIWVFGEFYPQKFRGTSFRPPKGTYLRHFMSNKLSRVKIHQPVWPVRESQKKRYK